MAHYAKLGLDNIVTAVLAVDTIDCMNKSGIEIEEIGIEYLTKHYGHENWKKCSFNTYAGNHRNGGTPFRANHPGVGWYYNSEYDIFHPAKPERLDSWSLNTTTGHWNAPVDEPTLTEEQLNAGCHYDWDEAAYQVDNTAGWVLVTPSALAPDPDAS